MSVLRGKKDDFDTLLKHLKTYLGKKVVFVPNQGNAGDMLIAHATLQMFESIGLRYKFGQFTEMFKDEILIYGGGGNLVGTYEDCKTFLQNNLGKNEITLLSCSIKDEDGVVSKFDKKVTVFCREKVSYQYVKQNYKDPSFVFMAPDMSFWIEDTEHFKSKKRSDIGELFRTDSEKISGKHLTLQNKDVSVELMKGITFLDDKGIASIAHKLLDFVSNFELVKTDRLHVAIACHLTNTPCELWSNNYYKNKAVYDYSLSKSRFVRFVE